MRLCVAAAGGHRIEDEFFTSACEVADLDSKKSVAGVKSMTAEAPDAMSFLNKTCSRPRRCGRRPPLVPRTISHQVCRGDAFARDQAPEWRIRHIYDTLLKRTREPSNHRKSANAKAGASARRPGTSLVTADGTHALLLRRRRPRSRPLDCTFFSRVLALLFGRRVPAARRISCQPAREDSRARARNRPHADLRMLADWKGVWTEVATCLMVACVCEAQSTQRTTGFERATHMHSMLGLSRGAGIEAVWLIVLASLPHRWHSSCHASTASAPSRQGGTRGRLV